MFGWDDDIQFKKFVVSNLDSILSKIELIVNALIISIIVDLVVSAKIVRRYTKMGYSDDGDPGPMAFIIALVLLVLMAVLIVLAFFNQQNCLQKSCKVGEPMISYGGQCICVDKAK